ncbi:hypothetical protein DFQ30_000932 [Apophysomyces sp. BC1015]|nr:hypothetical protein DFQ30_000932 [Apophysomyces sp. BC1015]
MPEDTLQYMIQTYLVELSDAYFESMTTWIIIMVFLGVHSTAESTTHVVYQLVAHPEYIKELLEEQEEALRGEATSRGIVYNPTKAFEDGLFTLEVYKNSVKLDSFIRESLRMQSGAIIRPGEDVYINLWHTHNDEKTQKAENEDIYNFHPYRYVGLEMQATRVGDGFIAFDMPVLDDGLLFSK